MNHRRNLIVALGAGALTAPLTAQAQAPGKVSAPAPPPAGRIWRVGFFAANNRPVSIDTHHHGAFARGMRELGMSKAGTLRSNIAMQRTGPSFSPCSRPNWCR